MKKVINGKLYNTESAKRLGVYDNGNDSTNLYYYYEELYKKRSGEFFIYGEGNAASKYSRRCGINEWCADASIIPITPKEAREWAEDHLSADEYMKIFEVTEDENEKITICFNINTKAAEKLKNTAAERRITQTSLLEKWIKEGK